MSDPIKFLTKTLLSAINKNATDLHLWYDEKTFTRSIRVNAKIYKLEPSKRIGAEKIFRTLKLIAKIDLTNMLHNCAIFTLDTIPNYNFRLSTLPLIHGEKAVIRILQDNTSEKTSNILADYFSDECLFNRYIKLISQQSGLILILGATNTGKTTIAYQSLIHLEKLGRNVITIEDPPERYLNSIAQLNTDANNDLAYWIKAQLRQDPDVLFIGEIRDSVSAFAMFEQALSGRLVISTMHATNEQHALLKLKGWGICSIDIKNLLLGSLTTYLAKNTYQAKLNSKI